MKVCQSDTVHNSHEKYIEWQGLNSQKSKKSRTSQFMHSIEVNYLTDTMLTLLLIYPSPEFRE